MAQVSVTLLPNSPRTGFEIAPQHPRAQRLDRMSRRSSPGSRGPEVLAAGLDELSAQIAQRARNSEMTIGSSAAALLAVY